MNNFKIKDSGEHIVYKDGMNRDNTDGKIMYSLIYMPMLKRWAEHMTKGAKLHGKRDWEKASTVEELDRFMTGEKPFDFARDMV